MTDPTFPPAPERTRLWIAALIASGVLLSVLPHLAAWIATGDAFYVPDGDGLLYLAWSRDIVRRGSSALTDAVHRPSGPMMHPWLLFVPPALIAHWSGLGMTGLGIVWRILGGAGIAIGLYAVVRPFTKTSKAAAGLSAFLLFDAGLLFGQILQRDVEIVRSLWRGSNAWLTGVPRIMAHLRVPPPALALPFLLIHFALALRARRLGTVRTAIEAGVSLGVLFHVYFYFATTAFLGVALAWILDRAGRATYLRMLGVGLAVAAPALIAGMRIKAATPIDWLHRTDKFIPVGRFDPARLLLPKALIAEWLIAGWVVFRTRREWLYLWTYVGAGLLLANHHIISGFDLENFHWTFAYGTAFSLLLALLFRRWAESWTWFGIVGAIALAVQIVLGLGLRGLEAWKTSETVAYRSLRARWRADGLTLPPKSVVAGPRDLLFLLGAIEDVDPLDARLVDFSSVATDVERDERATLNRVLTGRADAGDDHVSETSKRRRAELLETVADDPGGWADRFGATHLILPADAFPPQKLAARCRLSARGKTWALWILESAERFAEADSPRGIHGL